MTQQTDSITNLLIEAGEPDKDTSTTVVIYTGTSLGTSSDTFTDFLDDLANKITKSNKEEVQKDHRRCLNHVLNSLIQCMNRYHFFRHFLASVDNALHTLQATADYWNYVVACCCKTLQYNRTHHSSPHLS